MKLAKTMYKHSPLHARIDEGCSLAAPSPLNGERVGVRGGQSLGHPIFFDVSPNAHAFPAVRFPGAVPASANLSRWYRAQTGHLLTANSKTGASGCCVISDTHRGSHLLPGVRESHAARHPVPSCSALRRRKNPGCDHRPDAAAGICRPRTDGRARSPRAFFQPRWISCAKREPSRWSSSAIELTKPLKQFKPWLKLSPLTLALSPLRGEGTAGGSVRKFVNLSWRTNLTFTQFAFMP